MGRPHLWQAVMTGEDYEAAKPVPAKSRITGDPWKQHHPLCPVTQSPDHTQCCCCIALNTAERDMADIIRNRVVEYANSLESQRFREVVLTCANLSTAAGRR